MKKTKMWLVLCPKCRKYFIYFFCVLGLTELELTLDESAHFTTYF